jgi:general secretion pathway protein E
MVLRLLDRGGHPVGLDELGLGDDLHRRFHGLARKRHGILLATGPTGSGKTTTLYAALGLRHPTEEKVITVEDPVEYHLAGVTQVPVRAKAGMTFASALRSILRQDPDVLMVGEMRDAETARIAVQAAMTGHLVFSTLHTNDAVSAMTRLADLGVEPYMIAASLEGVLAQRLVRRICDPCRGAGCDACRRTGFRGRLGIFELLVLTDELRHALLSGAELGALRRLARDQGMTSMRDDASAKVRAGLTTEEEVLRVVSS